MRPLYQIKFPDPFYRSGIDLNLMQYFGEYCALSEDPLPDKCYLWQNSNLDNIFYTGDSNVRFEYFLLCPSCFMAQLTKPSSILLLPDDEAHPFTLSKESPFEYCLEKIEVLITDEKPNEKIVVVLDRFETEYVVVKGKSEEAKQTIAYFELNTRFFYNGVLTVPKEEFDSAFDRRLENRTQAWYTAEKLGKNILSLFDMESDNSSEYSISKELNPLIKQTRLAASASGFWATWASALNQCGLDRNLIRQILETDPRDSLLMGPGPHNPFPGTRINALG